MRKAAAAYSLIGRYIIMIQIYRILFLIFGAVETLANIFYLAKPNGVELAYNQHKEIPATASAKRMKIKIITMLAIGLLFLASGIFAFISPVAAVLPMLVTLVAFTVLMVAETACYRQAAGFLFSILAVALLVVFCLFA